MSDQDRGAYTPQTDPPLAFDPRRPSERRPLPMALIGSAVVLVVLLAGVAMVYRGGVRQAGQSPRPVGEPVMAVKTAPNAVAAPESDGVASTAATTDAYAPANQTAEAPKLAPAPEQPAARPPPSPATVALLAKPPAPDHIERPAPAAAAPAAPAPAPQVDETELAAASGGARPHHLLPPATAPAARTAAAAPSAPPAVRPIKAAKIAEAAPPKPPPAVAAATSAAAASAGPGGAVVQIGAFSSTALADQGYANVSAALPDRMSGKSKHVLALSKDGGTLYRTWLSGFTDRADAVSFCEALKAKGQTCIVKGS